MSKCREAFDAWWKSNGIEVPRYSEKAAAKKGWQAAWNCNDFGQFKYGGKVYVCEVKK